MTSLDIGSNSRPSWQQLSPEPASRDVRANANNAADGLDDLFNYDVDMNNASRTRYTDANDATTARRTANNDMADNLGLGIDEEVKVRKRRAPVAKLDEERLLSANGIPKLRKIAKDRIRFKGKGHEFSDVSRLLNVYQLWLDELFPKAKFTDGLAIIEKLGHKKRLQVMRKEWIDEEKPKSTEQDPIDVDDDFVVRHNTNDEQEKEREGSSRNAEPTQHSHSDNIGENVANEDDIYAEPTPPPQAATSSDYDTAPREEVPAVPDEDELDALLAEHEAEQESALKTQQQAPLAPRDIDFADDEEAMEGMW